MSYASTAKTIIQTLDVYLHGNRVGTLTSDKATLAFAYDPIYLESPSAAKLSASLPLQEKPFDHAVTRAFFSGLLPDGDARTRLSRYLQISENNVFSLLQVIGGECAGAVSLYPPNISPDTQAPPTYRILQDNEAEDILSSLEHRPLYAGEDDIRISGAGAQSKLMICFVDDKIAIPTGTTPSTHIIKPPISDLSDSVHNEFFCMKLAAAIGLPVPDVRILWLKGKPYYIIERYDRRVQDGRVVRLHQEDFCQAMHIPPEIKYENEGGPSLLQCFTLLKERIASGSMAGRNQLLLLQAVIFNYLIGNGDAHGKNFSLLYDGQTEALTPFYDLMSTVVYNPGPKAKMAMKIAGKYKFNKVFVHHWDRLAEALGFRSDYVRKQIEIIVKNANREAQFLYATINQSPETASPIYHKILEIMGLHTRRMLGLEGETADEDEESSK